MLSSVGEVPHADRLLAARDGHRASLELAHRHRLHPSVVAHEGLADRASGGEVPHADRPIQAADRDGHRSTSSVFSEPPDVTLHGQSGSASADQARGAYMITVTPSTQTAAPIRSKRSRRKPSKTTPQASDPATNTPP